MIELILASSIFFSLGFALGAYLKAQAWYDEDWVILKWNKKTLGYRPMCHGSKIKKGDNVVMSLKLNTAMIPTDGLDVIFHDEDFLS